MIKNVNRKKVNKQSKWDQLITDSNLKLKTMEARLDAMKIAIRNFEEPRDSGVPWPGTQSEGQDSVQQHSV
jgi:hypothetical protein